MELRSEVRIYLDHASIYVFSAGHDSWRSKRKVNFDEFQSRSNFDQKNKKSRSKRINSRSTKLGVEKSPEPKHNPLKDLLGNRCLQFLRLEMFVTFKEQTQVYNSSRKSKIQLQFSSNRYYSKTRCILQQFIYNR